MGLAQQYSRLKFFILGIILCVFFSTKAQTTTFQTDLLKPDPAKEAKFLPYLAVRHGGMAGIEAWKSQNTYKYYQELWYYSESFYVKRDHFNEGLLLDESHFDMSRFESQRKANEEAIVVFPGFKDVIVLLPANKLVYKPQL